MNGGAAIAANRIKNVLNNSGITVGTPLLPRWPVEVRMRI